MTTAEEYGNWNNENAHFQFGAWTLNNPATDSLDGRTFHNPNIRSSGTHPNTPTVAPNFDAETRIVTLYDTDNNVSTIGDNRAVVECMKYRIRWCGDGIFDSSHEQCDPNDPSHNGWSGQSCSATCTHISQTCQNGGINGQQNAPITATTPGLCLAGQTVLNFTDTPAGATRHNYTWDCRATNGDVLTGGTCGAWYDSSFAGTCRSLVVTDLSGGNWQNLPTNAQCTCTAGPGFATINNYHFIVTGANAADSGNLPSTATSYTWTHQITNTGANTVECQISGTDSAGNPINSAGNASCRTGFGRSASGGCADSDGNGIYDQCSATGTGPACNTAQDCLAFTGCTATRQCAAGGSLGNCTTDNDCATIPTWYVCNASSSCTTGPSYTTQAACSSANPTRTCFATNAQCLANPNITTECPG